MRYELRFVDVIRFCGGGDDTMPETNSSIVTR